MIYHIKELWFLIMSLFFINCNNKKESNGSPTLVDIGSNLRKMEILNLSQFTDNVRYVPLEAVENLIFTGLWDCIFSDSLILAKDPSKCLLYDFEGNVISKIGTKGRGPGEYPYISNACFGLDKNIYIQSLNDLYEFKIDGSLLNKFQKFFFLNNESVGSWLPVNDSLFMGKICSLRGNENDKALIFSKKGDIKYCFKNYIQFDRGRELVAEREQFANIYQFQNEIFFKEVINDTLFLLKGFTKLIPKYIINLGKFSEPITQRENRLKEGDFGISKEWQNYVYVENVFQTKDFLFFDCDLNSQFPAKRLTPRSVMGGISLEYNTTNALGIFNKKTKEFLFCKPTSTDNPLFTSGLYNDIDAGPRFFPMQMVNDSTMVMWFDAKQLKDHTSSDDFKDVTPKYPDKKKALEYLAKTLSEFDNPVLMFVTFNK